MADSLTNAEEVLFRQIHPQFIENGEPASHSFMPQSSDEGLMSVDRGSLTSAADSHALYVSTGRESAAVYGVTVSEFKGEDEQKSITCVADPLAATATSPANPAHALADYSPYSKSRWKVIAKRLKLKAVARGKLHPCF